MRWQRWRELLSGVTIAQGSKRAETPSAATPRSASSADDFLNTLTRVARTRGFDAAEQLIRIRTGRLWGRLSMVAEPTDRTRALDYAGRYSASVNDWISWLQRSPDEAVQDGMTTTASPDDELEALLRELSQRDDEPKPPLPRFNDRLLRTLEWRAKTEGFPAAEELIVTNEAKAWATLSRFYQHRDADRALTYARRSYDLDPQPTLARRLQQLLFRRGEIVEAERLFRASLQANGGEPTAYEAARLARLQGWKNLFLEGFPLPERRSRPDLEPIPRKVVHYLAHSLPHSSAGYDTRTHGLLGGIQGSGYSLTACTRLGYPWDTMRTQDPSEIPDYPLEDTIDGISYRRLHTLTEGRPQLPLNRYLHACAEAFETFARQERPSVIHAASNFEVGLAAVAAARRLGLPSVYEVRGLWEVTYASQNPLVEGSEFYATQVRLEAEAAIGADRVITITTPLKDELIRRGVPAERISVVPNCVDPKRFLITPRDGDLERQLGLEGKRVIGYVGSFSHYEGLDHLLYAISAVIDQGSENLHLLLVGGGSSVRRLYELVSDLELNEHVTLTGHVPFDEVHRYYSLIDIAPFPRKPLPVTEMVSPLKPLEAMAMEKAVLVSSVAALAEIVDDGTTGLIFEKGNIDSLAAALSRLVTEPDLCARLGKNAREWVLSNRTWEQAGAAVAEIYHELEEGSCSAVPLEPKFTTV